LLLRHVDFGRVRDEKWQRVLKVAGEYENSKLYVDDSSDIGLLDIRAKARRLRSRLGDLGLIVVDYLQLMSGRSNAENRQVEISEISRGLKILARELECPVVALSQLSRQLEMRADKRPMLADLRESGAIEQDADVVMFIYREDYYEKETEKKNIADILIKKHRNGPTGEVELYFQPEQTLFKNIDRVNQ
jgi:replicative DNA helicase